MKPVSNPSSNPFKIFSFKKGRHVSIGWFLPKTIRSYYLRGFVARDIQIAVHLKSPQQTNLDVVRYSFSK